MRILLFLITISLSSSSLYGQKNVNKLIDKIKKHPKSVTMTLPGWLISKAVDVASKATDIEEDEKIWLQMAKDIKQVRFSVVDEANEAFDKNELDEYIARAKEKDGFEVYAKVKDQGNRVNVMLKTKEDVVKNILIYAFSKESVAAIHLKTDISLQKFKAAKFSFNKEKEAEAGPNKERITLTLTNQLFKTITI